MYLLANFEELDPTRSALLRSGLELLAERGYKGAITREIAQRAGVSEVTLFRHYGSKESLLREAVHRLRPPIEAVLPVPSADIEADLVQLVANYSRVLEANGGLLVRLLSELTRHPELVEGGGLVGLAGAMRAGFDFMAGRQRAGLLRDDEPPTQAMLALMGPVFARKILTGVMGLELPLDPQAHVRGFLEGRRKDG
ncbi:MAG: helix-turn-helix domain-containing protein [Meiothermus sp.]|nr:helix-turn-helix domain-containing protein [Meiothermus sp.]